MLATFGVIFTEQKLAQRHPLHPWEAVGSSAWIQIDTLDDSIAVWVRAPEVDSTQRFLGWAYRGRDNFLRSPYADTKVYVTSGLNVRVVKIARPGVYPVRF